ncbi:response regulator [Thalassobius vesicularis]|nr:response regulator transcription factor [Thalassobius vesicularis]
MKILVADDHKLVREIISTHLEKNDEIEVTECGSVDEALERIETVGSFDVVLLDLAMPGMNGLNGLTKVVDANSDGATVLFSGTANPDVVNEAVTLGARGFIPKTLGAGALVNAIQLIASGEVFLPSTLIAAQASDDEQQGQGSDLTPRERSVLRSLCNGNTNKEIAREEEISEVTVKMHLRAICKKLDARNRTHAALIARELGLS